MNGKLHAFGDETTRRSMTSKLSAPARLRPQVLLRPTGPAHRVRTA